jgi:hypothetical protein
LGIKLKWESDKVFMNQEDAVEALWKKYPSERAATTPTSTGFDWAAASTETTKCNQKKYQLAVGSLLYLARMTRPDILYATTLWGRYASNPTIQHWDGVLRTISYLYRTKKDGTAIMKPKNIRVEVVCDASFAPFGQNSQSGTVLCIDRSQVGWSQRYSSTRD